MNAAKRVEIVCEQCSSVFIKLACFLKQHPTTKYCSRKCMGIANLKKVQTKCAGCGIDISKPQCRIKANNFCSQACFYRSRARVDARWRNPVAIKAYMKSYQERTKPRRIELAKKWIEENKDKKKATQLRYRKANVDKIAAHSRRRKSIAVRGDLTPSQWSEIKSTYGGCVCCREVDVKLTLDHIVPISKGGAHTASNVQPLCKSCNSKKGTKTIDFRPLMKEQHGIEILET